MKEIQVKLSGSEVEYLCDMLASALKANMPARNYKDHDELITAWRGMRDSYVEDGIEERIGEGLTRSPATLSWLTRTRDNNDQAANLLDRLRAPAR